MILLKIWLALLFRYRQIWINEVNPSTLDNKITEKLDLSALQEGNFEKF